MSSNWTSVVERYLAEGRTVSGGKGASTADQQRQAELKMQQDAYNTQKTRLAQQQAAFEKYTTQNIGFDPQQYAAMQSQIQNQNTSQFNSAGAAVRSALLARGGAGGQQPVGGDYTRGIGGLMGAQASDLSQNLNSLRIANAQQMLANRFNAGNLLSGNAATLTGTQGVAGQGASEALKSYITAKNSGIAQSFAQGFGGALGGGLGYGVGGGIGTAISNQFPGAKKP